MIRNKGRQMNKLRPWTELANLFELRVCVLYFLAFTRQVVCSYCCFRTKNRNFFIESLFVTIEPFICDTTFDEICFSIFNHTWNYLLHSFGFAVVYHIYHCYFVIHDKESFLFIHILYEIQSIIQDLIPSILIRARVGHRPDLVLFWIA